MGLNLFFNNNNVLYSKKNTNVYLLFRDDGTVAINIQITVVNIASKCFNGFYSYW